MSIISFNESIQKGEYKKAASDRPERRSCLKVKIVLSMCQMLQERNCVGLCPIFYAADLIQFLYVVYCVNVTDSSALCPHDKRRCVYYISGITYALEPVPVSYAGGSEEYIVARYKVIKM